MFFNFFQVKAFIDANIEFKDLLVDGDPHLHSALLKSYLRELPEPLLGRKSSAVYQMWCDAALLRDPTTRIKEITRILHQELPPRVVINIQYLVKVKQLTKSSLSSRVHYYSGRRLMGSLLDLDKLIPLTQ